jgi:C4-dicarboxylate transporter DctM subunit
VSQGLWVLLGVFTLAAVLGAPLGLSMLAAGFVYLIATHQDVGLVVDQTMNGLYNSYLLIAVPMFIFVANVMNASGVIERLLRFGAAMVGHLPGGLAQVNVVTNLIFSGMSGSAVADASGPGLIVARMMTRNGRYPPGFAAATSVVSATLGPLMPTSIPMIFYALQMPAILGQALLPIALPAILLGLIYSGVTTPTEAAAIAASYALLLALVVYRTLRLQQLVTVISDTVRTTAMIALIMSGAFVFNYAVANEGVPQLIQSTFVSWKLSPIEFLLCVDVLMLFLAIVLDEVTILLVIVPLLVPIAVGLDIDLVHFGIVVVLNMMVGLTLPPHGLLLFVMSGLTGTPLADIFRETPPFIVAMLAIVVLVTFFPDIALWLPRHAGLIKP